MKRGQVTLFMIIGIMILVASAIVIFIVSQKEPEQSADLRPEADAVQRYIEDCLEEQLHDVVSFVALQGGYNSFPEYPLQHDLDNGVTLLVPFYYYEDRSVSVIKDDLEVQLADALDEASIICRETPFPYGVQVGPSSSSIRMSDKIRADVKMQVKIEEGGTETTLDSFIVEIDSRLNDAFLVAKEWTDIQSQDPSSQCLTCLYELTQKGWEIEGREWQSEDSHYTMYSLMDGDFIFNFAHKIRFGAQPNVANTDLVEGDVQ